MKLDRPTHVLESNRAKMWMSEFTEEVPGQITAGIKRLGDGRYTYYTIYPLPPNVPYDEFPPSEERIQTTGVAPDRLTVEIKKRDAGGVLRLFTVGHAGTSLAESPPSEPISNGDNTYLVLPSEVLSASEAVELFQSYYDTHNLPSGWVLREQPEFADTGVAAGSGAGSAAGGASSTGRAPVEEATPSEAKGDVKSPKGRGKPEEQGKQ